MVIAQKCLIIVVLLTILVSNGVSSTPLQQFEAFSALDMHSRQRRDVHAITKNLIAELVANLHQSAADATTSFANFNAALGEEARLFNEQLFQDIGKLKAAIQQAVDEATAKAVNVASEVLQCVENERATADDLFNATISQVTDCGKQRLDEFASQLADLADLSNQATTAADEALKKSQQCMQEGNMFAVSGCLMRVLIETQFASVTISGQIGIVITRMSLAVQSLPLTLSVCTGARLAEAVLRVTSILFNIGQCAVKAVVGA